MQVSVIWRNAKAHSAKGEDLRFETERTRGDLTLWEYGDLSSACKRVLSLMRVLSQYLRPAPLKGQQEKGSRERDDGQKWG